MKVAPVLLLGLHILAFVAADVLIGSRSESYGDWSATHKAELSHVVPFTIFLKQRNLDSLEEIFKSVSDPRSPQWGKFLSKGELKQLIGPEQGAFEEVADWVGSGAHLQFTMDSIKVTTTVKHASHLFGVPFYVYENLRSGRTVVRAMGDVTIPKRIARHVDFVAGLTELWSGSPVIPASFPSDIFAPNTKSREPSQDLVITPSVLRSYYNVPSYTCTNSQNGQGIAAFQDYFSIGALHSFTSDQNLPYPNVTRVGPDCFPQCDQYESDLDVQYITSMGSGANTLFLNQAANYWILQFCEDVLNTPTSPTVFSISYGWSELSQCTIAVANCGKLGYTSEQYVNRTNNAFKQLGTLGVSVLVSDGDDGAPSLGAATGNCPMDPNIYCPVGGCDHTSSQCNTFQILNTTSNQLCFFPMGIGSTSCSYALNDPNLQNGLEAFLEANQRCNLNIETDYEQLPHVYSSCGCNEIKRTESSGYIFSQYSFNTENGAPFTADYPTSSPYVTSVGATQFLSNGGRVTSEVAASILTKAIITTGGGFSTFQGMPDYQQTTVQQYLTNPNSNLPPSDTFDANMRAYPDVSFNGHNYLVYYSNDTSDNCPCPSTQVDGTSASSPALAGLVTVINDQLLNRGKTSLGFLNYVLYQMYNDVPATFHDIVQGNNKCNRGYCCQYGYTAVQGWDPVTGLGSPNFALAELHSGPEREAQLTPLKYKEIRFRIIVD